MNPLKNNIRITFLRVLWSNKKIFFGFFFVLLLSFIIAFYSYNSLAHYIKDTATVNETFATLNAISSLNTAILIAETNQRGFLITGNDIYLSQYETANINIYKKRLPDLQKLIQDSLDVEEDMRFFNSLKGNIDTRFSLLQQVINLKQQKGLTEAIDAVKTNEGKKSMDAIQADLDAIAGLETQELRMQLEITQKQAQQTLYIIVLGISLATMISLVGIFIIISDQVKGKKLEKDLINSEAKYRLIFEHIQDIYYKTDMLGNLQLISPSIEKYLGVPSEKVIGLNVLNFYVNPKEREKMLSMMKETGSVTDFPMQLKVKDNKVVYALTSSHFIFDEAHNPIGIEGIVRDVTSSKEMEDTLRTRTEEAERLNAIAVNRELKMIELKEEVAKLKAKIGV